MTDKGKDGPAMLYMSTVLQRPGWTKKALDRFAPEPDQKIPNPHYRSGSFSYLYLLSRIEEIENRAEFQAGITESQARRASAAKSVATKQRKMLDWVKSLDIKVEALPLTTIVDQAIRHHALRAEERGHYDDPVDYKHASQHFLDRIAVNYLRHRCSSYEQLLDKTWGKVGAGEAYRNIRSRVLDAIARQYPPLREECGRQVARMEEQLAEAAK